MVDADFARDEILGKRLVGVCHSQYTKPAFIVDGIGPARFRSHYLQLENGIVLDLFTAEITRASIPTNSMPGETTGIPLDQLLGRRIIALASDDTLSSLVILEGGCFLRGANDGFYGNPLEAGQLVDVYRNNELQKILDYWTSEPLEIAEIL